MAPLIGQRFSTYGKMKRISRFTMHGLNSFHFFNVQTACATNYRRMSKVCQIQICMFVNQLGMVYICDWPHILPILLLRHAYTHNNELTNAALHWRLTLFNYRFKLWIIFLSFYSFRKHFQRLLFYHFLLLFWLRLIPYPILFLLCLFILRN